MIRWFSSPEDSERIDFISSYCDRWCERCAFTDRCSSYACQVAIEMCGDFEEGLELAVGQPRSPDGKHEETVGERLLKEFSSQMPTDAEMGVFKREKEAHDARVQALPLTGMSDVYVQRSTQWLDSYRATVETHPDALVREALAVVSWDAYFIGAKIHRALSGRDRHQHDREDFDPVQNDWNGSAKVALISIKRSAVAWKAIGSALNDAAALTLADGLDHLRRAVLDAFPDAMAFVRPGFDTHG